MSTHLTIIISALVASFFGVVIDARSSFTSRIPNGNNVPSPCGIGMWTAVGHGEPSRGTGMNAFGRDFDAAGKKWTSSLCQKDSDGDGRTNGEELGDPNCVWTSGSAPARTTDLGHPGICEPITSDTCKAKNTFLTSNNCGALAGDSIPTPATAGTDPVTAGTQSPNTRPPRGPSPSTPSMPSQKPPRDPSTPMMARTSQAPPQTPWKLNRNCVCFCLDMPAMFSGRGYNNWDDEDESEEDDDYEYDDDEEETTEEPWTTEEPEWTNWNRGGRNSGGRGTASSSSGRGRGRGQPNQQRSSGTANTGRGGSNSRGNSRTTTIESSRQGRGRNINNNQQQGSGSSSSWSSSPSRGSSSWQRGNNNGNNGRGGYGSQMSGRYIPPPVSDVPEFNNSDQYSVTGPCNCACSKA